MVAHGLSWILGPTKAIWYPKCGQNELNILVSNWFNWLAQSQAEIGSEWDFAAEHIFMWAENLFTLASTFTQQFSNYMIKVAVTHLSWIDTLNVFVTFVGVLGGTNEAQKQ